jgi:hypothetical protein
VRVEIVLAIEQRLDRVEEVRLGVDRGQRQKVQRNSDCLWQRRRTLTLKSIGVSRVDAHQLSKNADLLNNIQRKGFRIFRITDGYDETWTWDLSK